MDRIACFFQRYSRVFWFNAVVVGSFLSLILYLNFSHMKENEVERAYKKWTAGEVSLESMVSQVEDHPKQGARYAISVGKALAETGQVSRGVALVDKALHGVAQSFPEWITFYKTTLLIDGGALDEARDLNTQLYHQLRDLLAKGSESPVLDLLSYVELRAVYLGDLDVVRAFQLRGGHLSEGTKAAQELLKKNFSEPGYDYEEFATSLCSGYLNQ